MTKHLSARGLGIVMVLGGLFVLWISMIEPLYAAINGQPGVTVYTGFGMKGTFFTPFVLFFGLTLMIGGDKARTLIDGDHRYGKQFWIILTTFSFVVGGVNTWWFRAKMDSLHMRTDYAGHMIKGQAPMFANEKAATAYFEAEAAKPRAKFKMPGLSLEAWKLMEPKIQAKYRRDFPDMVPESLRKDPS